MRVVVIGKGTIGSAISKVLEEKGHEVVSVSRNSGKFRADISDSESLKAFFSSVGSLFRLWLANCYGRADFAGNCAAKVS
jgi:Trk K+ transport system NAD-binding subunit